MADPLARLQSALAGRYTIERELGRGGMATVYLAHDLKHDRHVALKVLRPELAATLGPDRFLREIQIAARLAHPHILALHDSGTAAGLLYYVMPYVEGESLRARLLREGQLPLGGVVQIAREVADALSYAHEHGVIHRDVKPENILLTPTHAVVADFGIARAVSAAATDRLTGSGFAVGTPGYMSPEQAANEPCDARADVYALGCVVYEMLAGAPPFAAASDARAHGPIPPLRAVRASLPPAVERVVERALAGAPDERFATAAQFASALGAAARRSLGVRLTATRRRLLATTGLAAALAVGVALGVRLASRPHGSVTRARRAGLVAATTSPAAVNAMLDGQERFWDGDLDGAAAAYRRALAADPDLALAYHRLGVVETWQWDYPAARRTIEAGLARGDRLAPRWRLLLQAERHYVMRSADSAIAAFQLIVVDNPQLPDGWYGLGEALFHFGGAAGANPLDARRVFERLTALDATFAPVYHHLVELALLQGDRKGARGFLAHMRSDDPERPAAAAAVALSSGDPQLRAATLGSLRDADRLTLKLLVAHFAHGALDLPLVDTLAGLLSAPGRTPDDRLTGAQYRLAALAGQGRWREAAASWDSLGKDEAFDRWMVLASLAGHSASPRVAPMLAWARAQLAGGRVPDFRRPLWENAEQGFQALAHDAALHGDSASVGDLLRRLEGAALEDDPSDPIAPALRAALQARLALLARDTARAVQLLDGAVSRSGEPFGMFYPLAAMAPERWLLVQLALARGDRAATTRWLASFAHTWSLGDAFYATRVVCLQDRLAAGGAFVPSHQECPD